MREKSEYRFYYTIRGAKWKAELGEFKVTEEIEQQGMGQSLPSRLARRNKRDSMKSSAKEFSFGESSLLCLPRFNQSLEWVRGLGAPL